MSQSNHAQEEILRQFGELICRISTGETLTREETSEAYRQVILNEQPELQQGAFLMSHFTRVPTTEELMGVWDALDRFDAVKIRVDVSGPVCDIAGTGSSALKTVNCFLPAAFIAAACGLTIAKKGSRHVTGIAGESDIMEYFGLDLSCDIKGIEESLTRFKICYIPSERFLPSSWARLVKSIRFTSAFNIVGPTTRLCRNTDTMVIGGYAPHICNQLISVLRETGMTAALASYGLVKGIGMNKGMDEFSPAGQTRVVELRGTNIKTYNVAPEDFGIKLCSFGDIACRGTIEENAEEIIKVLKGACDTPLADFFCMNAAAALYISNKSASYREGVELARQALISGKAYEKLEQVLATQGRRCDRSPDDCVRACPPQNVS